MADQQADFANHVNGRAQEQIERTGHDAFGGVFHAHHTILRGASCRGVKHLVKVGAVGEISRTAKELDGGLLTEGALRPQHCHPLRCFQRQTGRHDFTPDAGHMTVEQRTRVGLLDVVDDLGHAIRAEERRPFLALDLAHLFGHMGTFIEQLQQLLVQRVDLLAQHGQIGRLLRLGHACAFSKSCRYSTSACTPSRGIAL